MRLRRGFMALGVLLALASGGARAAAVERQIHYRDCGGLICLEVPMAGRTDLFLLDTGNVTSTIDLDLARKTGLKLTPAMRRDQPDQAVPGMFKTALPDSVVAGLGLAAPAIIAMDLKSFSKALGTKLAGTFAYPLFKDRVLQLDPRHRTMTIDETGAATPPPGSQTYALRLVTFGSAGPPILTAEGVELNGQKFLAQLDTDFPEGAMLFPRARDALGLQDTKPVGHRILGYYDDNAELLRLPAGKADFGNPLFAEAGRHVFLAGKGVHSPDNEIALVVGTGWFKGKQVTLDLHDMIVTIAPLA
jgi:hypothetical protein